MTNDLRHFLIWALFLMAPLCIGIVVGFFCLTAPSRRNERARLFLDLLETGLRSGLSPERTITSISETRDRSVSAQFHLVVAHIEEGARLADALDRAPQLLPRGIAEVIKVGAAENALDRLLPAARAMLDGLNSRMRSALNYVLVLVMVILPGTFAVLPVLSTFVWPKLKEVLIDIEAPVPLLSETLFENFSWIAGVELVVVKIILFWLALYVAGPRLANALKKDPFTGIIDQFALWLPWRRRRAQRDFTGVLAVLLDAGIEETRAVQFAAKSTANVIFERRAARVIAQIREGVALPLALKAIERSNEFQWRWTNALRSGKGFFEALRGWHEMLEARAFQQEQAAAHVITSGIVIVNGAVVGVIAVAIFMVIIALIEEGSLW
jgi:type II secretory pathway component PulF